jgi:hypothetical protein
MKKKNCEASSAPASTPGGPIMAIFDHTRPGATTRAPRTERTMNTERQKTISAVGDCDLA